VGYGDFRVTDTANGYVVTVLDNRAVWPAVTICLSINLFNTVAGLMGDFDGNFANDYLPRDATTPLSAIVNDTYLASAFGESWRVTAQTSTFYYGSGETYASKNDPTFQPYIFDAQPFVASPQAEAACSGLQDDFLQGCLRDVTLTGDTTFALQANATAALYNAQEASYRGTGGTSSASTVMLSLGSIVALFIVLLL